MADPNDYFGDISVPDDNIEQQQDETNDVTFGDIGDIKAGDETSEFLWKPNHNTFSSTIQEEKKKFLLDFDAPNTPSSPTHLPNNHENENIGLPHHNNHPLHHIRLPIPQQQQQQLQELSQPSKSVPPSTTTQSQQFPRQPQPQPQQQVPIPRVLNASPISTSQQSSSEPFRPPLPPPHVLPQTESQILPQQLSLPPQPPQQSPTRQHPMLHQFSATSSQQPPSQQPQTQQPFPTPPFPLNSSMSIDDYERNMIAFYEQQARDALTRHEERVAEQLQKALIAQRAGVSFDRGEFDRHQEGTRQFIMSDFYMRIQQLRMIVWQRRQNILQQQQRQGNRSQSQLPNLPSTPTQPKPPPEIQIHPQPQLQQTLEQQMDVSKGQPQSPTPQDQLNLQKLQQEKLQNLLQHQQQQDQNKLMQQLHMKLVQAQTLQKVQPLEFGKSSLETNSKEKSIAPEYDQNFNAQTFDLAASILAPLRDELDPGLPPAEANGFETPPHEQTKDQNANGNKKLKSAPGLYSKDRSFTNGVVEKDPRMQEIERQMAQAGLGPKTDNVSANNSNNNNNSKRIGSGSHRGKKRGYGPLFRNGDQKTAMKKSDRRLESMTNRDQELVFRVHLRQIESSAVYKDDYYSTVTSKKLTHSTSICGAEAESEIEIDNDSNKNQVFSELAEIVQSIRLSTKERGREGGPRQGSKKSKRSNNQNQADATLGTSPTANSESVNSRPFATSLGTVQSWNPRAPRRVMGSSGTELMSPDSVSDEKTSILNDVRVRVRRSIEDGYDIIATIHDICRGESTESVEKQIGSLLATLHVREEHGLVSLQERESWHSTRFFEYICSAEKGRGYLGHVVELLDLSEMARLMPALFANLGSMVFSVRLQRARSGKSGGKATKKESGNGAIGGIQLKLCRRMMRVLRDAEVEPGDCLAMLQGFIVNHALEERMLICTLRSVVGARLLLACVQRILKGLLDEEVLQEEVERCHVGQFAHVLPRVLANAFKGAASKDRIWDLIGGIDGLLSKELRSKYRSELTRLVTDESIPRPPEV